jgi:hypothetical protein
VVLLVGVLALATSPQLGWRAGTPEPILDDDPGFVALYWKTWEAYHASVREDVRLALFPPRYAAPNDEIAFDDAVAIAISSKWGWRAAPSNETLKYALQLVEPTGKAPRAVSVATGTPDGVAVGPPLAPLVVYDSYLLSGDRAFLQACLSPVVRRQAYLESVYGHIVSKPETDPETGAILLDPKTRRPIIKTREGPRFVPPEFSVLPVSPAASILVSTEALALSIQANAYLSRCAEALGLLESASLYRRLMAADASKLAGLWHEEFSMYVGRDEAGAPAEQPSLVTAWALLGGALDATTADRLSTALSSPELFGRRMAWPLLPYRHSQYRGDSGVRPLYVYLVARGLLDAGKRDQAAYAMESFLRVIERSGGNSGKVYSDYGPDTLRPAPNAHESALAAAPITIAGLIEVVIGISADAPNKRVFWSPWRRDRHGLNRLRFGSATVSLVCEERTSRFAAPTIVVETDEAFTLVVRHGGRDWSRRFSPGRHVWTVSR